MHASMAKTMGELLMPEKDWKDWTGKGEGRFIKSNEIQYEHSSLL